MLRRAFFALPCFVCLLSACPGAVDAPAPPPAGDDDDDDNDDVPTPIGTVTVTDAGASISAVTTGFADTIVGPLVVEDAASGAEVELTLVIPAVALAEGVAITMTPVTISDAPFESFTAVRLEPSGTTFRVPATLVVEGLPSDATFASGLLEDDGSGTVLTYVAVDDDARVVASIEHFSIATIVDAATTSAAIGAAGLANIPRNAVDAAPLLTAALEDTVLPAIEAASGSLTELAFAQRMLAEWGAAVGARGLESTPFSGLGGRTFGQAASDAAAELTVAAQELLEDLQRPVCVDGTGQLNHPAEWFSVLGHVASSVRLLGGDDAVPNEFAPCLTLAFTPSVLTQARQITRDERFVQVFVGLDATSPTGFTAPMPGSYRLDVTGALGLDGTSTVLFDAVSPALAPVDLDRGAVCEERAPVVDVILEGALRDTLGLANLNLESVTTTLRFEEPAAPGFGPSGQCQEPAAITIDPLAVIVAAGDTLQFTATTTPAGLPVTFQLVDGGGTIDATTGLFTAGPDARKVLVAATAEGGAQSAIATVGVVRPGIYPSTSSTATADGFSFSQGATWQWTVELPGTGGTELILRRAARTSDPQTPEFATTQPINFDFVQGDSQRVLLRSANTTDFAIFNVQQFATGADVNFFAGAEPMPQGLNGAGTLFDPGSWQISFFE